MDPAYPFYLGGAVLFFAALVFAAAHKQPVTAGASSSRKAQETKKTQ